MRFHVLKRWLNVRWRKPWVKIATSMSVLLVVVILQYYLINLPTLMDVENVNPKVAPAKVVSRSQKLLIELPAPSGAGVFATHTGKRYEIVEAHFDRAQLSQETLSLLRQFEAEIGKAPASENAIDFFNRDITGEKGKDKLLAGIGAELSSEEEREVGEDTCRTDIRLTWQSGFDQSQKLYFHQNHEPGLSGYRSIEMEATGAALTVALNTMIPPGSNAAGNTNAPGCGKLLRVGQWKLPISAPREIKIVIPAGSGFRFRFSPYRSNTPIWEGGGKGQIEPLHFEPAPFDVQLLSVLSRGDDSQTPLLKVSNPKRGTPLVVNRLLAGTDQLIVEYSGQGFVEQNGELRTTDFFERLRRYPLLAAMLATANTALLGWFFLILRGTFKNAG